MRLKFSREKIARYSAHSSAAVLFNNNLWNVAFSEKIMTSPPIAVVSVAAR